MMLKEATIKNLELEMYEKRLTDVKIEMEKTRRRMVALRAVDYKRKKEFKEINFQHTPMRDVLIVFVVHGTHLLRRRPSKVKEKNLWASHA